MADVEREQESGHQSDARTEEARAEQGAEQHGDQIQHDLREHDTERRSTRTENYGNDQRIARGPEYFGRPGIDNPRLAFGREANEGAAVDQAVSQFQIGLRIRGRNARDITAVKRNGNAAHDRRENEDHDQSSGEATPARNSVHHVKPDCSTWGGQPSQKRVSPGCSGKLQ